MPAEETCEISDMYNVGKSWGKVKQDSVDREGYILMEQGEWLARERACSAQRAARPGPQVESEPAEFWEQQKSVEWQKQNDKEGWAVGGKIPKIRGFQ